MSRTLSLSWCAVALSSLAACASAGSTDVRDAEPAGPSGVAGNKSVAGGAAGKAQAGAAVGGSAGSPALPDGGTGGGGTAAGSGGAHAADDDTGKSGDGGAHAAGGGGSGGSGKSGSGGSGGSGKSGSGGSGGSGKSGSGGAHAAGGGSGKSGSGGAHAAGGSSGKSGGAGGAGAAQGGGAGHATGGVAALVSEAEYDALFPHRDALFTYQGLVQAAATFPAFASTGTPAQRRRELAAFLANIGHETTGGWPTAPGGAQAWGLHFKQEVGCEGGACTGYCEPTNVKHPCAPGKTYHGRGPMQLSYNYNYGACGDALGIDLLHDPDLVTSSPAVTFRTALWFWMTPQPPKPSAHDVMTGGYTPSAADLAAGRVEGFGLTIDIINGGVECGYPTPAQVKDRVAYFQRFCAALGVDTGPALECATMQSY